MFEPVLKVRCLEQHRYLVDQIIPDAELSFHTIMEEQTGLTSPFKIEIDTSNYLSGENYM